LFAVDPWGGVVHCSAFWFADILFVVCCREVFLLGLFLGLVGWRGVRGAVGLPGKGFCQVCGGAVFIFGGGCLGCGWWGFWLGGVVVFGWGGMVALQ